MQKNGGTKMQYLYCLVKPLDTKNEYYYLSDVPDLQIGDYVEIPFGYNNTKVKGKVITVEIYEDVTRCPYPPQKTKHIIQKISVDAGEHVYCQVKPITHKEKTFFYICDTDEVKVGDYVDIPYGKNNEIRIAEVLQVVKCNASNAPIPFQESKKVIRILTEENSDYVSFIKRWNGSHIINRRKNNANREKNEIQYKINNMEDVDSILNILLEMDKLTLLQKLVLLKSLDSCYSQWGSEYHKYKINDPVTREEVTNFEKAYEVILPYEYVEFITEVGNGALDIYELDVWNYHMSNNYLKYEFTLGNLGNKVEIDTLRRLFGAECETECEECENRRTCPASYAVDDYDKIDYAYLFGTLPLSYQGCTYMERLVVSGPRAGSVWMDNEGECMALIAETFGEYINNKIDNLLQRFVEYLKLIKNKNNLEQILSAKIVEHGYFDKLLMLCGILNIKVDERDRKNKSLLKVYVKDKLDNLYNN